MKANQLLQELTRLIAKHGGDLPVTFASGPYEYSVSSVHHVKAGPLANLGDLQKQNPPERIFLEGKDNLPSE